MQATHDLPDVERLSAATVDVTPQDRDWSEGYGDSWEYFEAPECPECGEYAQWKSGPDLDDIAGEDDPRPGHVSVETWESWRCPNVECERFGDEIERGEGGDEGPMMNYAYPLPEGLPVYEAADKLRDLPLCIVVPEDRPCELALTGGGMDLSWEICEAFMRLGYLPPLHFCDLPRMAGMDLKSTRNRWIVAGCLRTCEVVGWRVERRRQDLESLRA